MLIVCVHICKSSSLPQMITYLLSGKCGECSYLFSHIPQMRTPIDKESEMSASCITPSGKEAGICPSLLGPRPSRPLAKLMLMHPKEAKKARAPHLCCALIVKCCPVTKEKHLPDLCRVECIF